MTHTNRTYVTLNIVVRYSKSYTWENETGMTFLLVSCHEFHLLCF